MVMSPSGNITSIMVGSSQQFVCSISPCIKVGNIAISIGEEGKLFGYPCNSDESLSSRISVFCRSDLCRYGVNLSDVTVGDDGNAVVCGYRPQQGDYHFSERRYIRVFQKPKTKPKIEPTRPFLLMEEVIMTCTTDGGTPMPTIVFSCGSTEGHMNTSEDGTLSSSLQVTMDSRMTNVQCRCFVDQDETEYHEETYHDIIVLADNLTTILPQRSFVDGENVSFVCCDAGERRSNTSITFNCHGQTDTQRFSNNSCLYLPVTVDIEKNGTDCICSVVSEDGSIDISSEIQLQILPYNRKIQLPSTHEVSFRGTAELTCLVNNLEYPFTFGPWMVLGSQKEGNVLLTSNSTTFTVADSTYKDIGEYSCVVIDQRKNGLIVASASTLLTVNGPIFLKEAEVISVNETNCIIKVLFQSYPEPNVKSLWIDNKRIETFQRIKPTAIAKNAHNLQQTALQEIEYKLEIECPSLKTYGMVVSNEKQTEEAFYFNSEGKFFNGLPMLKADAMIIDGNSASVTCLDVRETKSASLHLDCENISEFSIVGKNASAMKMYNFIADIDKNGTNCSCYSSKWNESSTIVIPIKPYFPKNISRRFEVCASNSKTSLTCRDADLPQPFIFGAWIHRLNGVVIRSLSGTNNGDTTSLEVPFCTFEDIGNYSCTITDTRKNKTVFSSTVYLSVPGPPVIINGTMETGQECILTVNFYSFDTTSIQVTWYKDGKRLHANEHQTQDMYELNHHLLMHNTRVQVEGKTATLQLTKDCDIDKSIYRVQIENNGGGVSSYTFEKEDKTVQIILVVSLTIATGVFLAGIMVIVCKNVTGLVNCDCLSGERAYNTDNYRQTRGSQFYEEIDMVIESLRMADEEEWKTGQDSDSKYDRIPADFCAHGDSYLKEI